MAGVGVGIDDSGVYYDWRTQDGSLIPLHGEPFAIGTAESFFILDFAPLPDGDFLVQLQDPTGTIHLEDLQNVKRADELMESIYYLLEKVGDHDEAAHQCDRWFALRSAGKMLGLADYVGLDEMELRFGKLSR